MENAPKVDLIDVQWELAPNGYNQADNDDIYLAPAPWIEVDEEIGEEAPMMLIVPTELGRETAIAIPTWGPSCPVQGDWADSSNTAHWGALDEVFGREQWRELLADTQEQALVEMEKNLTCIEDMVPFLPKFNDQCKEFELGEKWHLEINMGAAGKVMVKQRGVPPTAGIKFIELNAGGEKIGEGEMDTVWKFLEYMKEKINKL